MKNTILLVNENDVEEVYAIIRTDMSYSDLYDTIDTIKEKYDDGWDMEDIFDELSEYENVDIERFNNGINTIEI